MEVFWSVRLLEWIALAGVVAAIRRAPARGAFLVVWFVMFIVVKGSSSQASISTTSYFRLTEPGLPGVRPARRCDRLPRASPAASVERRAPRPVPRWALAVTAVVGALVPLVLVLALRRAARRRARPCAISHTRPKLRSRAPSQPPCPTGRLSWKPVDGHGARLQYVVYRVDAGSGGCTAPTSGAHECLFAGSLWRRRATTISRAVGCDLPRRGGRELHRRAERQRPDAARPARDRPLVAAELRLEQCQRAARGSTFWSVSLRDHGRVVQQHERARTAARPRRAPPADRSRRRATPAIVFSPPRHAERASSTRPVSTQSSA